MMRMLLILLAFFVLLGESRVGRAETGYGMRAWEAWLGQLNQSGYRVSQGGVKLFDNATCAELITVFGSCFANNPAAPYFVPEPPVDGTYVDPVYGTPFTTPGATGAPSNMFYRLANTDALVTLVALPSQAAYMGYQSYVFTRAADRYPATVSSRSTLPPTPSPDTHRYEIFGSIGNDINNVIIANRLGSVWNNGVAAYVTTSNMRLAKALVTSAKAYGLDERRIFIEPVGKNILTGTGREADDLIALIRYALPKNELESRDWQRNIDKNIGVFRVSAAPGTAVERFPTPLYTKKQTSSEEAYAPSLDELSSLLSQWLTSQAGRPATTDTMKRSLLVGPKGKLLGFVGRECIAKAYNCLGDNQDTDSYRFGSIGTLSENGLAIMTGINHTRLDNASYISIGVSNKEDQAGVGSASQTDPATVGFESGTLTGSAEGVLKSLGLYERASPRLKADLPYLYTVMIERNCTVAPDYCVAWADLKALPLTASVMIFQRAYLKPGTTTGANPDVMPSPKLIYTSDQ